MVFLILGSIVWVGLFIFTSILSFNGVGINNDDTHETLVLISNVFAGLTIATLIIFTVVVLIFEYKKKKLLKKSADEKIIALEKKIEILKSVFKGCMSLFLGITIISVDFPLVITYLLLTVSILLCIQSFLESPHDRR